MNIGKNMINDDTWYKCTICGREGRVSRCCGDETRIPLNTLAIEEQKRRTTHQSSGLEGAAVFAADSEVDSDPSSS
jgi:hypothetical protein